MQNISSNFSYSRFSLADELSSSFSFATINPTDVQQAISDLKSGNGTDSVGLEIKYCTGISLIRFIYLIIIYLCGSINVEVCQTYTNTQGW